MEGFHSSKHIQVLKIAALLTAVETGQLTLMPDYIALASALVERIEPGISSLYQGAGRNELAAPMENLLQAIRIAGGALSEKEFLMLANRDMQPRESYATILHLEKTEQVRKIEKTSPNGVKRFYICLPEHIAQMKEKGLL